MKERLKVSFVKVSACFSKLKEIDSIRSRLRDFRKEIDQATPAQKHQTVPDHHLQLFTRILNDCRPIVPQEHGSLPASVENFSYLDLSIAARQVSRLLSNSVRKPMPFLLSWGGMTGVVVGVLLVTVFLGLIPLYLAVNYWALPEGETARSAAATFGDSFGMANAIVSGLAFAAVIITLRMQKQELTYQRTELTQQRKEVAGSKKALEEQARTTFLTAYLNALHIENQFHEVQIERHKANTVERIRSKRNQRPLQLEVMELVRRLRPFAEDKMRDIAPEPLAVVRIFADSLGSLHEVAEWLANCHSSQPFDKGLAGFQKMILETHETFSGLYDLCQCGPHSHLYQEDIAGELQTAMRYVEGGICTLRTGAAIQEIERIGNEFGGMKIQLENLLRGSQP